MSTEPPTRSRPAQTSTKGEREARVRLGLEGGLHRLGYRAFRTARRRAIETLLRGRRLLLVAPTGGGKSLIDQLSAALLPGTALVISPLVSPDARPGERPSGPRRRRERRTGCDALAGALHPPWI